VHDHVSKALKATSSLWDEIERSYRLVSQAAQVLDNAEDGTDEQVEGRFERVLQRMSREVEREGSMSQALRHFLKVTASYEPHLFFAYRLPGLPRTNNDLEQLFGSVRYHERRISGRKVGSPSLVVRGAVRLIAAVATRLHRPSPAELQLSCLGAWWNLRRSLDTRHQARREQLRFRRDPHADLARLEQQLLKPPLPS
jgi:hypothetical protein